MASTGEVWRLDSRPAAFALAAGGSALAGSIVLRDAGRVDWFIARRASDWLLGGGLDVYAAIPEAQMGPLSLVLAWLPWPVYVVVTSALMAAFAYIAAAISPTRLTGWHSVAACVVGFGWNRFAVNGHMDDALVLVGLAVIVAGMRKDSPSVAALGFVVAIAAKPTAVIFLPLVFLASRRQGFYAMAGMAAVWLPFFLADVRGFLGAGQGIVTVSTGSLVNMLGYSWGDPFPMWVRPVQLVGGLVICWAVARRVSPEAAVVVGLAFRAALEPGVYPPYCTLVASGALLLDLRRAAFPTVTFLALGAWLTNLSTQVAAPASGGPVRLLLLLAAGVVAIAGSHRSGEGQATWTTESRAVAVRADPES